MATVSPLILDCSGSAAWSGSKYYWQRTDGTKEIYSLGELGDSNTEISVETNPNSSSYNIWEDHNLVSPWPQFVTESTVDGVTKVILTSDQYVGTLYQFIKPTVASWISIAPPPEEPPTNTEGSVSGYMSWFPDTYYLIAYISASSPTTIYSSTNSLRSNFYRIIHTTDPFVWEAVYHTTGDDTSYPWRPPVAGTYELQHVLTNPSEVDVLVSRVVTQSEIDAWHLANPPPPPPSPVFVPRSSRRGNLNFW